MTPQSKPFNELTPAQAERLAFLAEELGEAQRAIGKVLRHGYNSVSPLDRTHVSNRHSLTIELGHVMAATEMLTQHGDVMASLLHSASEKKLITVWQWMHHEQDAMPKAA